MEKLFIWAIVLGGAAALATGRGEAVSVAVLESGKTAVALGITLAGAYCLWCGVLRVMEVSGLAGALSRALRPLLRRLFPGVAGDEAAEEAVSLNLSANLLGMGNAATPAGLTAIGRMRQLAGKEKLPTRDMCMFLIVNSSSIQLVPTTVISLRAASGAASPADILLPTLLSTLGSTLCAVALALLARRVFS